MPERQQASEQMNFCSYAMLTNRFFASNYSSYSTSFHFRSPTNSPRIPARKTKSCVMNARIGFSDVRKMRQKMASHMQRSIINDGCCNRQSMFESLMGFWFFLSNNLNRQLSTFFFCSFSVLRTLDHMSLEISHFFPASNSS